MNAKTLSGLTAIAVAAVSMSLGACDQRSPGSASTSGSAPATSAQPSGPMTGTPAGQMATPSSPAGDKAAAGAVDDAALTAQVKSALQSEAALRSQAIDVDSKNATITLTGSVDSAASKARANEVAAGVNGVVAVVDQLTIKTS